MATAKVEGKKSDLSSADIVLIIRASARCGIQVLKFRDLEISFGRTAEPRVSQTRATQNAPNAAVGEMTDQEHKQSSEESLEQMEFDLREQQLEELKLTNPAAYEELVNSGELTEDDDTAVESTEPID